MNCILKAAEQGVSIKDCVVYVTLSPCLPCSEMLKNIKVKRVVYRDKYRCEKGIRNLITGGVEVEQYESFT